MKDSSPKSAKPRELAACSEESQTSVGMLWGCCRDALSLWPITAAPEGHQGMEVWTGEIDELFAPWSQVQTHLRALLTESRGESVLLTAVQHLPFLSHKHMLSSSTTNAHSRAEDTIEDSKAVSLSPKLAT